MSGALAKSSIKVKQPEVEVIKVVETKPKSVKQRKTKNLKKEVKDEL